MLISVQLISKRRGCEATKDRKFQPQGLYTFLPGPMDTCLGVKTLQHLLDECSNDTCKQTCTHTDPTTSFPTSESTTLDIQEQGIKWFGWRHMFPHSDLVDGYCSGFMTIIMGCRSNSRLVNVSMYLCCQTKSFGIYCTNRSIKDACHHRKCLTECQFSCL